STDSVVRLLWSRPSQATEVIPADRLVALPAVTITPASVLEGDQGSTSLNFDVSLSAAASFPVSMLYFTWDGSATAGEDYVAIPPTTLTFAPRETHKTITVVVTGDESNEETETLLVNLVDVSGGVVVAGEATGTILDDDPLPTLSI